MPSMNVSQARKRGYTFDSRDGRLLFRTPYGQPDSLSTEVNHRFRICIWTIDAKQGLHAFLCRWRMFQWRQCMQLCSPDKTGLSLWSTSWLLAPCVSICLYVILVTFCLGSGGLAMLFLLTDEGYFDDGGYMMWKTPEALYPSVGGTQIRIGLNGDAMEQLIAEKRGYIVEKHKGTVHIGIPYNAEGGHRKVRGWIFNLRIIQILQCMLSVAFGLLWGCLLKCSIDAQGWLV